MEVSAPAAAPVEVNPSDAMAGADQAREAAPEPEAWEPDEEYLGKRIKRMVNGKEVVRPLKEWLERSHYGEKATQSLQEAAQIRKEAEQWRTRHDAYLEQQRNIFESLRGDPENVFELARQLGHDVDALILERAMKEIQYRTASEEERAQIDRAREYEKIRQENERYKKQMEQSRVQQFRTDFNQRLVSETQAYAEQHPDFATDPDWQSDAISEMIASRQKGQKPLSLADAAERVRQRYERISSRRAEGLLREQIKSGNIPAELKETLRAQEIERVKETKRANFAQPKQSAPRGKQPPTPEEFFNSLKNR